MTTEQIIKALECLSKPNSSPDDRAKCYFMWKEPSCFNCYHEVAKNALALIKSLQGEIRGLNSAIETLQGVAKDYAFRNENLINENKYLRGRLAEEIEHAKDVLNKSQ